MAHLLIVELPGGNDTDILQAALDRGDEFTFLTADLDHYRMQPAVAKWIEHAVHMIEVPSFDETLLHPLILAWHAQHPLDAVLCLLDIRLVEAARLASALHLRFLNPDSAQLLRDKFSVRQCLQACGIPQGPFAMATSNLELQDAVKQLGLPVLIKPADGYGSQNVVLLENEDDLAPWITPLNDLLPSRANYGLGVQANDRLLVERFMTGKVIGCDTFTQDGQHVLLGINEKMFFEPPSFAIQGGCFTPNSGQFQEIEAYVSALLDAVHFDCGAAHVELMLTDQGPQLIEINARLVGAKIGRLINFALNTSVHQALIALHLGQPWKPSIQETRGVAVTRWLVAPERGALQKVELPSERSNGIRCFEILKNPGDYIQPPMENADRLGYVMACAATQTEAEGLAEQFIQDCVVVMS